MWFKLVKRPVLLISLAVSIFVWLGESLVHYVIFDYGHSLEIIPHDVNELWMRIVICSIIIIFGIYTQIQTDKNLSIENEKLQTLKATMHTVEDCVGNTLMGMKYTLHDAEKSGSVNKETHSKLIQMIDMIMTQLRDISSLESVDRKPFTNGITYLKTDKKMPEAYK